MARAEQEGAQAKSNGHAWPSAEDHDTSERARCLGVPLGPLSLVVLVAQTRCSTVLSGQFAGSQCSALLASISACSGGTLVLRYSRVGTSKLYNPASAVLMTELCKLFVLAIMLSMQEITRSPPLTLSRLKDDVMHVVKTALPMLLPASLFIAQQQLNLIAATGLDAVTFQVTNQFKVLPTAVFSVLMLDKKLSLQQWLSLPLLSVGVAIVNNSTTGDQGSSDPHLESTSWWAGLLCALAAGVTSGYAGVHFERSLKSATAPVSLWAMNVQLSVFGSLLALANVLLVNWQFVRERGLLYGFGPSAWTVVLLQAVGGLIVAVTIRYADNILKGFATAVSIVVSWIISVPLFGLKPNFTFALGITLVIASLLMYSLPPLQSSQLHAVQQWLRRYANLIAVTCMLSVALAIFCTSLGRRLSQPIITLSAMQPQFKPHSRQSLLSRKTTALRADGGGTANLQSEGAAPASVFRGR